MQVSRMLNGQSTERKTKGDNPLMYSRYNRGDSFQFGGYEDVGNIAIATTTIIAITLVIVIII